MSPTTGTARRTVAAGLLAAVLALAGCSSGGGTSEPTTAPATTTTTIPGPVVVSAGWAAPSAPGATTAGVYLTITSPVLDSVIGVSVPSAVAARVQMQRSAAAGGGTTTLVALDQITLPARVPIVLFPGGIQLTLIDLVAPLVAGDTFPVNLLLSKAGTLTATVTVRPA